MQTQASLSQAVSTAPTVDPDTRYEIKAVLLLALGVGMVGLDRFIINPLFPVMAKDLGLSYQDLGLISGVLALTWGAAAMLCGGLADRFGAKRVLVPAMVVFSILVVGTGFATGLMSLIIIRGVMGVAEGAYMPAGVVATNDASHPSRIGLNTGLTQMAMGLFGMALAPVLATQLLNVVPSWHWVFGVVAIPGLVVAYLLHKNLRDRPPAVLAVKTSVAASWREVMRYRNVVVGALCALCWLSSMIVMQAFMPNYLTDYLKLGLEPMGFILAGAGLGAVLGMVGLAGLSDRFGRKPVMVIAIVIGLGSLWALSRTGAQPAMLFGLLFLVSMVNTGLIVITVGPIATQSVPLHLAATASGMVMGFGEIVGGALVPAVTGGLANVYGIQLIMWVAMGALALGLLLTLFGLQEPEFASAQKTRKTRLQPDSQEG